MKTPYSLLNRSLSFLVCLFLMTGCSQAPDNAPPQVADINSVGCLIANDFYAVHFSAYLQPSGDTKVDSQKDREALLKPYCQELPGIGKAFFSADLIDRDVRKTPIGIRIIEVESQEDKAAPPNEAKEIRTLLDIPPKVYPRGVVEAQANIDKIGDYALILIIGGEEALSEDDKLHVPFHVGKKLFALSTQMLFLLAIGLLVIISAIYFIFRRRKQ
jgi:LPXTG-motif cell wall-anchored protein